METDFRTAPPCPANPDLPRISVLVMGHNQQDYMEACIDSVLSQRYDGWVEVVLCDDCSTDATYDIMLRKAKEYHGPFRVIAHRCPVNGRVAVNMNIAVSLSEGDWLMRVDGDDIMHPDRVRLTAFAINQNPSTIGITGQLIPFSGTPPSISNVPDEEIVFHTATKENYKDGDPPVGLSWWGCAMSFSRRIFTEFGNLPAECAILDDTMFATRILMLGGFVTVCNAYFVYYRRHSGNISSDFQKARSISDMIKADAASRDYYRRGEVCHAPILAELQSRAEKDPTLLPMAQWFKRHFAELRRQGHFWEKSWGLRIADAHISGSWWHKIPWAIQVICPLTYVLGRKLRRRRF